MITMREAMTIVESGATPAWLAEMTEMARKASDFDEFKRLIQPPTSGPYRPRTIADAIAMRQDGGSLASYSADAIAEMFGAYDGHSRYRTPLPRAAALTIYRATPDGRSIRPGDYVTESRRYAADHIKNNMTGGQITSMKASLDDLFPADGPHEFWYAPTVLDQFHSLVDFFEACRGASGSAAQYGQTGQ